MAITELARLLESRSRGSTKMQAALKLHEDVKTDASEVLVPLMHFLEHHMVAYEMCEKSVRKRLLKKMWRTMIRLIEEICLLPPLPEKRVVGENGARPKEGGRLFNYKENKLVVEEVSDVGSAGLD